MSKEPEFVREKIVQEEIPEPEVRKVTVFYKDPLTGLISKEIPEPEIRQVKVVYPKGYKPTGFWDGYQKPKTDKQQ